VWTNGRGRGIDIMKNRDDCKVPSLNVTLPVFTLTQTCSEETLGATKREIPEKDVIYYYRSVNDDYGVCCSFNGAEMVLCRDGSPWVDACLYLLDRLIDNSDERHVNQKSNIARDLDNYRQFIDEYEVDYFDFPRIKMKRPTYRYRAHLKSQLRSGQIAKSTATRFMQSVISFYRWLVTENDFKPQNPLWNESDAYINYDDSVGFERTKTVKTTDVAIKGSSTGPIADDSIMDEGELRPLPFDEQLVLIDSLIAIGNQEMTLIMLMALFSGARIQTVLTLKVRHFNLLLPDHITEVPLQCGPSTAIDTKNDKKITIKYPRWLHDLISAYAFSDYGIKRRDKWKAKALREDVSDEDSYVFLTNRGNPYYEDSIDGNIFNPNQKTKSRPDGSTVRTFISLTLLPFMQRELGDRYSFKFHDLRATFGMNLTDSLVADVETGKITLTQARNQVRDRMGHGSYKVTDNYLGYREKTKLILSTQASYERHLKGLVERIMGGVSV